MNRSRMTSLLVVPLLLLGGCASAGEPGAAPSASASSAASQPTASTTPVPAPSASTATASSAPSANPSCEPFGSTRTVSSADPQALSTLTGASMRVGRHDCFERFVFELQGTGDRPGWTVGYVDQLNGQASGEPVPLAGDADLEVMLGVWTVNDFEGRPDEWAPFTGADDIVTSGFTAIQEARNLYAYEGTTQVGLGVDRERPFRVTWARAPQRLIVDVYTGPPTS